MEPGISRIRHWFQEFQESDIGSQKYQKPPARPAHPSYIFCKWDQTPVRSPSPLQGREFESFKASLLGPGWWLWCLCPWRELRAPTSLPWMGQGWGSCCWAMVWGWVCDLSSKQGQCFILQPAWSTTSTGEHIWRPKTRSRTWGRRLQPCPFLKLLVQHTEMWEPQEMGIQALGTYPHLVRRPSRIV